MVDISGATAGHAPDPGDGQPEVRSLVARNVARLRQERGLSTGDLAREANVSKQTVWKIERGDGNPTVDTLADLAAALGVSLRALLTEFGRGILVERATDATWNEVGLSAVRDLYQVYGSGYVRSAVLRLERAGGSAELTAESPGSFHYLYMLDGAVIIRQGDDEVTASAGDFVRISGSESLIVEAADGAASVHAVTTFPQLRSTSRG